MPNLCLLLRTEFFGYFCMAGWKGNLAQQQGEEEYKDGTLDHPQIQAMSK